MMSRLTRKFESYDLSTLSDFISCAAANIEDSYLQLGAKPGVDYDYKILIQHAVIYANAEHQKGLLFTLENLEPTPLPEDIDPWMEAIKTWLSVSECGDGISVQDVYKGAIKRDVSLMKNIDSTRIGMLMRKLGWVTARKSGGARGYIYLKPTAK